MIGKEFGIKTCYTALILGPMMSLWERICPYERLLEPWAASMMGDLWSDLVCFILVLSMAQAIMFRINASTGGLDGPFAAELEGVKRVLRGGGKERSDTMFAAVFQPDVDDAEDDPATWAKVQPHLGVTV